MVDAPHCGSLTFCTSDSLLSRLYVNGLMNSFRVETFNISANGTTQSFFIQGGQRWQTVTLLSNTSVTISGVGFQPSVDIKPTNELNGSFSASNASYDAVWGLGARAIQAACVENGSQPSTWEVTDQGALVRGQYPAVSSLGDGTGNYTMSFSTKIVHGGTGWRVAGGPNGGYGAYFVLTTNGPQYLNFNETITPKNTLTAGYGFSIINFYLSSAPISHYDLPTNFSISENVWYRITTTITPTSYNISINGTPIASVDSTQYQPYVNTGWGTAAVTDGNWGFGPWLDQSAYFKDVQVTAQNGTVFYTNSLTTQEVYEEYSIATNSHAVCLDGAKRDRMIWIGDFVHTARELAASTGRYDFIQSMIEFEFEWQFLTGPGAGLVPIQAPMGAGYQYREVFYPSEFGETDYQFFFLVTLGDYFRLTSDTALLGKYWNGTKYLVETIQSRYLDPYSGLMAGEGTSYFTSQGETNSTAPTALFALGLQQLIHVAVALNDNATAEAYTALYQKLSTAINTQLWSTTLGAYGLSLDDLTDNGVLATAFTIRAGITNATQASLSVQALSDLFVDIGYKDASNIGSSATTSLSPNTQGFLLESLFLAHTQLNVSADIVTPAIRNMLELFWPQMVNQNEYYTGASWEYVYANGAPGLGIFTSLAHPWGGAPTYVLSDYVLGVRSQYNQTTGTNEWVFDPVWEVVEGLGLTSAEGRVPLVGGGYIEASWSISKGTNGTVTQKVNAVGANGVQVTTVKK